MIITVFRREYAMHGISVHIVEPGFLRTPMNKVEYGLRNVENAWNRQPDHVKQEFGEEFYKFSKWKRPWLRKQ